MKSLGVINVLDKHVAELIAAGEVVERPASAIKELIENSIDAGATSITVEIQNGGITYMRVTDNGCGFMREDVKLAFLPHATSKINIENDLDRIATLGFRGEALASISSVSRLQLITCHKSETIGTSYEIEGGEEVSFDDAGCPVGSTIIVRDLFYNIPARMKFLKKDRAEGNAVANVIDKIALSHPEIAITFIRDGRRVLSTSGDNRIKSAIYSVYGRDFANGLIPVNYELGGIKVQGYVSKPVNARPNRGMQNFFINGRYVRSGTASAAGAAVSATGASCSCTGSAAGSAVAGFEPHPVTDTAIAAITAAKIPNFLICTSSKYCRRMLFISCAIYTGQDPLHVDDFCIAIPVDQCLIPFSDFFIDIPWKGDRRECVSFPHQGEPSFSAFVLIKEQVVKHGVRPRLLQFTSDQNLADLHDPVIETRLEDRYFLLKVVETSDYPVPIPLFRGVESPLLLRHSQAFVKGRQRVLHGFLARGVIDHDPVFHLMIEAGIDDIDRLSAGGAYRSEKLPALYLVLQDRIQIRIDSGPDLKIVLSTAFRTFYSLNFSF